MVKGKGGYVENVEKRRRGPLRKRRHWERELSGVAKSKKEVQKQDWATQNTKEQWHGDVGNCCVGVCRS